MIIGSGSNKNKNDAIKINFNIKQYNTFIHEFDIYYNDVYGNEQAYDFTGCYLQFYIKSTYGSFIKKVGTISVIDNIVRIYIADNELDFYGKYKYELVVTTPANQTSTLVQGEMIIERSVVTTLQKIVNAIENKFSSIFSVISISLLINKLNISFSSIYKIILGLTKSTKLEFKTNYLINIVTFFTNKYNLNFNSTYKILLSLVTNNDIKLKFSSINSILQIIFINKTYRISFNSNYRVNLSTNYSNTFSFVTSYTITNL